MKEQKYSSNNGRHAEKSRILLVDDDDELRTVVQIGLEMGGFEVVPAATVNDALQLIYAKKFDVLLSDSHMPNAGDGLTVVSAMRHAHPKAVTLLLSGYPALQDAANAIMLQADEVLLKPFSVARMTEIINKKLAGPAVHNVKAKECVAAILDRDSALTIQHWMASVERNEELKSLTLNHEERTGHLPLLLVDLINRLLRTRTDQASLSIAARKHGVLRRMQGYTVAMIVEESRILQVSIFNTLHNNLADVDFDTLLLDVMTIADEVDSQLKQAVLGFMESVVPNVVQLPA